MSSERNSKGLRAGMISDLQLSGKCLNSVLQSLKSALSHVVYIPARRLTSNIVKTSLLELDCCANLHILQADVPDDGALEEKYLSEMHRQDLCLGHILVFTTP